MFPLTLLVLALIGLVVGTFVRYGHEALGLWSGRSRARHEGRHKQSRTDAT